MLFQGECSCDGEGVHTDGCVRARDEAMARDVANSLGFVLPDAPTVSDDDVRSWEGVAGFHDPVGPPGITHTTVHVYHDATRIPIHTIEHRDDDGTLSGVLFFYEVGYGDRSHPWHQRPMTVNVWVRPDRQRCGIGTKMGLAADERWPHVPLSAFDYTAGGLALARVIAGVRSARTGTVSGTRQR